MWVGDAEDAIWHMCVLDFSTFCVICRAPAVKSHADSSWLSSLFSGLTVAERFVRDSCLIIIYILHCALMDGFQHTFPTFGQLVHPLHELLTTSVLWFSTFGLVSLLERMGLPCSRARYPVKNKGVHFTVALYTESTAGWCPMLSRFFPTIFPTFSQFLPNIIPQFSNFLE